MFMEKKERVHNCVYIYYIYLGMQIIIIIIWVDMLCICLHCARFVYSSCMVMVAGYTHNCLLVTNLT